MNENNSKISVSEYLENKELIEISYIPFDKKMEIVGHVINEIVNTLGGLNTTLLRRISTEVFIETISNIDMNIEDENGLKGFDQLCFHNELENLKIMLGTEYKEFDRILDERVSDYIRIETNPSVTINAIYNQVRDSVNTVLDYLSKQIQNIDVEKLSATISEFAPKLISGDNNET